MDKEQIQVTIMKTLTENPAGVKFAKLCVACGAGCDTKASRMIDRTLQRLKKQGMIEYVRKQGWKTVP